MSVFTQQCFLFLRDPHGGVEDLDRMQAAGFEGVFCNIGDHPPAEWEGIVRARALALGMTCGPWLRTTTASGGFSTAKLDELLTCADRWGSPLIVNSESELKASGTELTSLIAQRCQGYDAAVSVEPIPFDDVGWWPLGDAGIPVLPQFFEPGGFSGDPSGNRDLWHAYGVPCCFPTFATYHGATPADYVLRAPYSLYTGDDCGGNFAAWSPTAYGYPGCVEQPPTPDGEDMTLIGSQHGVDAAVDRLVKLDPGGSKPNRNPDDLATWGAYDKLRRTLTILVDDHDEAEGKGVDDG